MATTVSARPATSRDLLKTITGPTNSSPIRYIPSQDFESLTTQTLASDAPASLYDSEPPQGAGPLDAPLLTPEGERHLFRTMNYYRFRASQLTLIHSGTSLRPSDQIRMREFLEKANEAREAIVRSNLRLVVSLAGKSAGSGGDLEELISEGNLILVNAVDKFDYSRGFRFSTYATHSIQRHFFRLAQRRQRRRKKEVITPYTVLENVTGRQETAAPFDHTMAQTLVDHFNDCLNERERMIIMQRFGLDSDPGGGTLKSVAERVGLSKERVRQLQSRAVEKLQDLAIHLRLSPEACL